MGCHYNPPDGRLCSSATYALRATDTLLDQRRELDTPIFGRPELQDQLNPIHN